MERNLKILATAALTVAVFAGSASAQYAPGNGYESNGTLSNYLFSQYTTNGPAAATAGMYPAPHPVPGYVGSAAYTYQPLQPHELMYQHRRNYYNYYAGPESFYANSCTGRGGGGGLNKTTVVWQSGANHMGNLPGAMAPFGKLHYALASRYYCIPGSGAGLAGGVRGHLAGGLHHHGATTGSCSSGTCGECESCGAASGRYEQYGQVPTPHGYSNR